ncbi:MAG: UDP-N-acetylglucosamine 1-carboxyvinyltransferase, partial [Planctomycetaceae bacterium]|nr:UDP-N-acetylglucosamine 1-carboxyvinyltransferase [Planctomycetaceae bacterium]
MDMLVVEGGRRLAGSVAVGGAKNAALPIMAAALAGNGPLTLNNVPNLVDVRTQAAVLHQLGVQIDWDGASTYRLEVVDDSPCVAPYELVRKMRASVCVLGPLLARRGKACVSLPGGCNIGFRPIDLHLKGLAALGADIRIEQGYVLAEARQLRGARVSLRGSFGSTVTGTCNVMTAATLARGVTIIDDAAREPEVVDLAECLQRMGAVVEGAGTQQIIVRGVSELSAAEHTVLPDRIEAATILCAGAITGGAVCVTGVRPHHLAAVLDALREAGADVQVDTDRVTISVPAGLRGVICSATPYPGIPTDVQAQITAVMTQASGVSHVADRVFPDRFMHLPELCRLGADIRRDGSTAVVHGPATLTGANLMACDLRASAALVLAALAATGESAVRRIYHLDRGYDGLESKLRQLGAVIRRENDTPAATPHLAASGSATDQCEL